MVKERKTNRSQYIPIVLVWFYIILFFFTDSQEYYDNYYTFIVFIDTFILTLSILYYFSDGKEWGFVAKKSLMTVISLNFLTEMSFIVESMPNYFGYYFLIICTYFLSLMVDAYNSFNKK